MAKRKEVHHGADPRPALATRGGGKPDVAAPQRCKCGVEGETTFEVAATVRFVVCAKDAAGAREAIDQWVDERRGHSTTRDYELLVVGRARLKVEEKAP